MKVTQSCPAICNPTDYTVHGILQARILERVACPFSRGSSQPRDQTQVSRIAAAAAAAAAKSLQSCLTLCDPTLQADSLPAEPQGKPKNTGLGSLSLLQQIFLTKESSQGLLHCRCILYQLSYQGSLREEAAPKRGAKRNWAAPYLHCSYQMFSKGQCR